MKRILPILAAAAVAAASFTACNNQPPVAKLARAVEQTDSVLRTEQATWCDSASVAYDELTNAVTYTFYMPGRIDKERLAAQAAIFEQMFVETNFVAANHYNIGTEIVAAHANVLVAFKGADNSEFELLIENDRIAEAYNAAHTDSAAE